MPDSPPSLGARLARGAARQLRAQPVLALAVVLLTVKQLLAVHVIIAAIGDWVRPNTVVSSLAASLLFLGAAAALPRRAGLLALVLLDAALTFVLQVNLLYFRQYADLISLASVRYAGLAGDVHGAITQLLVPADALLWLDVALLLLLALGLPRRFVARLPAAAPRTAVTVVLCGAILLGSVAATTRRLRAHHTGHTGIASTMNLVGYQLFDASTYLLRLARKSFPSEETVAGVRGFLASRPTPPATGRFASLAGKNVIVVQVESLQAFAVGLEVGGEKVTPALDSLAAESLRFPTYYSQIGQGTTSDAELLSSCSLYPARTGSVFYDHADSEYRCLPGLLRARGYRTVAMHANRPDFWNRSSIYPALGYDRFFDMNDFDRKPVIGMGLSDEVFLRQAVEKLQALPEPYYAFLVTLTNHKPFDFPEIPRTLPLGKLEGTLTGNYLHSVHLTDAALGQLVERLRSTGILERSILVVYGDHQGLVRGTQGLELLGLPQDRPAGVLDFERLVPMLLRLPGGESATLAQAAGQVDLAPTLADLLGIPPAQTAFFGRSLLGPEREPVVFADGSARSRELLFLSGEAAFATTGCFDAASGERQEREICTPLAEAAGRELDVSRDLVEANLVPRLFPERLAIGPLPKATAGAAIVP